MPPNDACSQPLRRCGGTGTERANRGWPSMSIRKPALLPPRGLKKKPARESSNVNRTIDTKGRLKHGILGCSLPLPHAISPNRQIGKSAGVKAVGFGRFRSRLCQRGSRLETAGRTRPAHAGGGGGGGQCANDWPRARRRPSILRTHGGQTDRHNHRHARLIPRRDCDIHLSRRRGSHGGSHRRAGRRRRRPSWPGRLAAAREVAANLNECGLHAPLACVRTSVRTDHLSMDDGDGDSSGSCQPVLEAHR